MADHVTDEELQPEGTEGFKVGVKKTIDEYTQLGPLHPPSSPFPRANIDQTRTTNLSANGKNPSASVQALHFPIPKIRVPV